MNESTLQRKPAPAVNGGAHDRTDAVLARLEAIDRRLAGLEAAALRVEQLERTAPAVIATVTDTLDDVVDHLRARGIDAEERLRVVLDVLQRLTSPRALEAVNTVLEKLPLLQHLLDSEIFAATSVDVVGKAGAALATTRAEHPRELGMWGVARAMTDDDVKRALGFLVRVAQLFGRSLEDEPNVPALTEGERS
jgi:uncharacterized protein YjgD (DUF1641 family)